MLVFFFIVVLIGQVLSAIDLNKGMDDILFDSFCGRASVKNMMKECYLPTVESEDNLFGVDSYSAAESGIVSLGSTFEPYGTQTATTFRIVSKGTISVTCYNSIPKWEQDPTDLVQVIPVNPNDNVLDFADIIVSEVLYELTGLFTDGAVIVYKSNVDFTCAWSTVGA